MKNKPLIIAIVIPVVAMTIAVALIVMKKTSNSASDSIFPFDAYINSPISFAGNTYSLNATIDSQLSYADNNGRIILLKTSSNKSLPIFVPYTLNGFNPNVGQRYYINTKIDQNGKLIMTNFSKM